MTNQSSGSSVGGVIDENTLREHLAGLFDEVEFILDKKGVSEDERTEIQKKLEETVSAEIVIRISARLSDKEKGEFFSALQGVGESHEDKKQAIEHLLNAKLTKEDKARVLLEATENVLKEFTEKMKV